MMVEPHDEPSPGADELPGLHSLHSGAPLPVPLVARRHLVVQHPKRSKAADPWRCLLDNRGREVGWVYGEEFVASQTRRFLRFMAHDPPLPQTCLDLFTGDGRHIASITWPAKSEQCDAAVVDAHGVRLGTVTLRKRLFGGIDCGFEVDGVEMARLDIGGRSLPWRLKDTSGSTIGRITRRHNNEEAVGLLRLDDYLLEIDAALTQPLQTLVLIGAATLRTGLRHYWTTARLI